MASAHEPRPDPSLAELFRSLVDDTRRLVRDEIDLAKAEVGEKARYAARQSLLVGIGAGLAIVGSVVLLAALTLGVAHALTPLAGRDAALWLAPLLIGALACGAGGLLLYRGVSRLRAHALAPNKTLDSLRDAGRVVADHLKR